MIRMPKIADFHFGFWNAYTLKPKPCWAGSKRLSRCEFTVRKSSFPTEQLAPFATRTLMLSRSPLSRRKFMMIRNRGSQNNKWTLQKYLAASSHIFWAVELTSSKLPLLRNKRCVDILAIWEVCKNMLNVMIWQPEWKHVHAWQHLPKQCGQDDLWHPNSETVCCLAWGLP